MTRFCLSMLFACSGLLAAFMPLAAVAEVVRVAVAANFAAPMKALALDFEKATGHKAQLSFGSTGKFYAQITNGAPFDVFLAADDVTPARLEDEGRAVIKSHFTYAAGRLVLWSAQPGRVDGSAEVLKKGDFRKLAIAAPKLAPYGAAAMQTLDRLGLLPAVQSRLVLGESIGQTFSFVQTGNADLGFVALSQVYENGAVKSGSAWIVPATLHKPIRQDAVLLAHGASNKAASELLAFLKTEPAKTVIRSFGYEP